MIKLEIGSSDITYGVFEKDGKDHFYIVNGDFSNKELPENEEFLLMLSFTSKEHINNVIKALNLIKNGLKWTKQLNTKQNKSQST